MVSASWKASSTYEPSLLAALRAAERYLAEPYAIIEPIDGHMRIVHLAGRLVKLTLYLKIQLSTR